MTEIKIVAKNAGTSVNQIERFYARHILSPVELIKNLQRLSRAAYFLIKKITLGELIIGFKIPRHM